jgi:hypothetical protein
MAWEDRLALDMMLAEKEEICVMIGGQCCAFIPSNTAPNGTITSALKGLTTLANKIAKNSGVDELFNSLIKQRFKKLFNGIHFHFPDNCVRSNDHSRMLYHSMYERAHPKIETTLTKKTPTSDPDNLLSLDTVKQESINTS